MCLIRQKRTHLRETLGHFPREETHLRETLGHFLCEETHLRETLGHFLREETHLRETLGHFLREETHLGETLGHLFREETHLVLAKSLFWDKKRLFATVLGTKRGVLGWQCPNVNLLGIDICVSCLPAIWQEWSKKIVGHNGIKTTLRYLHTSNKDLLKILSPLDSLNLEI